jgi:hypothetical protein
MLRRLPVHKRSQNSTENPSGEVRGQIFAAPTTAAPTSITKASTTKAPAPTLSSAALLSDLLFFEVVEEDPDAIYKLHQNYK